MENYQVNRFQCFRDTLTTAQSLLTWTAYDRSLATVKALEILENNKQDFAAIRNERDRNNKITELTKLTAEPGLIPGELPEEIAKNIDNLVSEVLKTFDDVPDKNAF